MSPSIKPVAIYCVHLPVPTKPAISTIFSGKKDMISSAEADAGKEFTVHANKVIFDYNVNTRELYIPDDMNQFAAFGAHVEINPDQFYRMSFSSGKWYADPQELFQAKIFVEEDGFEVIKDDTSGAWRWRARNWVEESGLHDTDDDAYFDCVERNHIPW